MSKQAKNIVTEFVDEVLGHGKDEKKHSEPVKSEHPKKEHKEQDGMKSHPKFDKFKGVK